MTIKGIWALAGVLAAGLATSGAGAQETGPSVASAKPPTVRAEMWNTEQFVIRSQILGRDMLIQVAKPMLPSKGKVPAVYLVDGNLYASFALNPMAGAFVGEYAPAYYVAVGYPEQNALHWLRQRATDLLHQPDVVVDDEPGMKDVRSGGGALFQRFLVEEVRPQVEARYPIDGERTVLSGISFGGLFAARVMLDQPSAFGAYLIGSPSLWADPELVTRARTAALRLDTRIYISAGGAEEAKHLASIKALAAALRANRSGVMVTEWIVPEEGHVSFAPTFFSRALKTVLPPAPR